MLRGFEELDARDGLPGRQSRFDDRALRPVSGEKVWAPAALSATT